MRRFIAPPLLLAALLLPAFAFAQTEEDPLEDRAETFQAAEPGAQTENISGALLMITAYGIVWVLVFGYIASLGFRQASTQRDLERLRGDLAARPASDD